MEENNREAITGEFVSFIYDTKDFLPVSIEKEIKAFAENCLEKAKKLCEGLEEKALISVTPKIEK